MTPNPRLVPRNASEHDIDSEFARPSLVSAGMGADLAPYVLFVDDMNRSARHVPARVWHDRHRPL